MYFYVWLQNKGKILSLEWILQFNLAHIKRSPVSLLEPWQNSLSNPQAYLEPCYTSKTEYFPKIVNH